MVIVIFCPVTEAAKVSTSGFKVAQRVHCVVTQDKLKLLLGNNTED